MLGLFSAVRLGASFSPSEQSSQGREVSWTSSKQVAMRSGEPRSLCLGVTGFDSRGREGSLRERAT